MNNNLQTMIVLYREPELNIFDIPLCFKCLAEDSDHAEEQCLNAYPDATVEWVYYGNDIEDAYDDFYGKINV